ALRLIGGAYLVLLGLQALANALRRTGRASTAGGRGRLSRAAAYRRGLMSNVGNPKMAVFFTSLLPQFAPRAAGFWGLAGLELAFCLLTLVWLSGYAVVVARMGDLLRRSRVRRV